MKLPVMPPVKPMLAKAVPEIPEAPEGEILFEPKWDGFRCIVFRDGDEVELGSRNERPLTRYFPELLDPLRAALPERCVVDGEVVVTSEDGLDFDALQQRIHPAESRINRLAAETPARFVAFDLLALDDRSLLDVSFAERRAELERVLGKAEPPVHLTPSTSDRSVAQDWFVRFEGAGLDGVIAKPAAGPYVQDKRVQFKIKHLRTADCVVAGYRTHKDGEGVGSLLLGLYDDEGNLHHMGVASSFSAARRRELVGEVKPYEAKDLSDHPWGQWAEAEAHASAGGRMPGGQSRWNAKKDLSFTPLRPELVAEVAYERVDSGRFRHSARLQRWRPDRDAASCTFDQLEVVPPHELVDVFGASSGIKTDD
jgi:ATP-dependent DNA ligase